jgi:2-polyprenyl-3-methyl-5-hydroxy-6-metoxy-1,4-benzoquinol methylase
MQQHIHLTHCPLCGSAEVKEVLTAKDYTVSGELFPIVECSQCTLRFTQEIPEEANSKNYYKSEDYISHSDTSKGLINRLYLRVRRRTMKWKRRLVEKNSGRRSGCLLDVGSGTGVFAATMKESGWQVTGIEPDAGARSVAEKIYHIQLLDENKLFELPPGTFDVITLWHVLEHIYALTTFMQQLKQLLKKDGKLIVAVPNYTSYDARKYGAYWAAYDAPRHLYHFSPTAMEKLAELNGLFILKHYPMWYDSFYISLLSSRNKNRKARWLPALWTGLLSNLAALFDTKNCSSVIYVMGK